MAENDKLDLILCWCKEAEAALIGLVRNLNAAGRLPDAYLKEWLMTLTNPALDAAWEKACQEEVNGLPKEKQVEFLKRYSERLADVFDELRELLQREGMIKRRLH